MARQVSRLSALMVNKINEKGLYPDGGNLYLQVSEAGTKSWIFRYMINKKARSMGLGALHTISLADARIKAADCRKLLDIGIDPIQARASEEAKKKLADSRSKTFEDCATAYIDAHKASWRNVKHQNQWTSSLSTYAYPVIGKLPVQNIDVALVMKIIEPIWQKKTETANRVRGRIENILDWATAREYRQGENPARWRGKLENLLPNRSKIQRVKHHSALPYADINEFIKGLRKEGGTAAKALELVILTASRTNEVIGAKWKEFDLKKKIWIIPANRIKNGKEHRVPLSEPALSIIKTLEKYKTNDFVFPGLKAGKPLSNMAMLTLLKRMKREDITVHGFRSSFRQWAAEQTSYQREIAEMCLSHTVGSSVERSYQRSDLFVKRHKLMNEWAGYCYKNFGK